MASGCVRVERSVLLLLLLCSAVLGACRFARSLNISGPNLEALSGTCFLMPCTFTTDSNASPSFNSAKPVTAIWSKSQYYIGRPVEEAYVIYNSDRPSDTPHVKIIGDLQQKSCSTEFSEISLYHADEYFLRIENEGFKASVFCDPLQIQVKDSPWSPSLQVSGRLKEEESVTISCSAPTPCPHSPPKLSWNLQQDPPHTTVTNTDGTLTTSIQHSITLSDRHHGLQVSCTAVYPVTGEEKSSESDYSLMVEHSPKDTSVQSIVNSSVSLGQTANLSCFSRGWPEVSISWFRISSGGSQRVHEGHVYSFIFKNSIQRQYFCQAKNRVGEQNSPVITVGADESSGLNTHWMIYVGVGVGLLILICGAIFIGCLVSKRRPRVQPRSETSAEVDGAEDGVHYGELVFSKPKPQRPPPAVVHQAEDSAETVYSQVRVSKPANAPRPSDDVYAVVKKR